MSHTPGPWVGGLQISSSSGSKIIAHIQTKEKKLQGYSNTNSVNPCEALANARLIAAAPELLNSLKALLPFAEKRINDLNEKMTGNLYPYLNICMIEDAKKAITKATGEQSCGIPD